MPIRELFKISAVLSSGLAFILAGKAARSLQEAGILYSTILPWNIRFDTIRLFPKWQTIAAQVITLGLSLVLVNINTQKD